HRVEAVHVQPEQALDDLHAAHGQTDERARHDGDEKPRHHRPQGDSGGAQHSRAQERLRQRSDDPGRPGHVSGSEEAHDQLPETQHQDAAGDLGEERRPGKPVHRLRPRQEVNRSSRARPSAIKATPSSVMTSTVASSAAVSKFLPDVMRSCPIPLALRKNSAATTPTRPRPIAWRTPVIAYGNVPGSITSRQIAHSPDRYERATSISSGRTASAPSMVL